MSMPVDVDFTFPADRPAEVEVIPVVWDPVLGEWVRCPDPNLPPTAL